MCERTRSSHRRRKGTAAATFVIYEGSKQRIANQVNALLDGGAKIFRVEMIAVFRTETIAKSDPDYAVSVLFVANYFHPINAESSESAEEPDQEESGEEIVKRLSTDAQTIRLDEDEAEPERETVTEDQLILSTEEKEEEKFKNTDLSKAEDIVDPV